MDVFGRVYDACFLIPRSVPLHDYKLLRGGMTAAYVKQPVGPEIRVSSK